MTNSGKKRKKVSPPFGYFGSKNRLAGQICKLLPPHNAWVELFCGSAAVTLAKPKAPVEVINDIDDEIVNVFEQLRKHPKKLIEAISLTPYARQELLKVRRSNKPTNKLERARRFLVASMFAVNGVFGQERGGFSYSLSYSRENKEARVNRWYNLPLRLTEVVERLRSVRIEKKDALKLLEDYVDRPATLVYIDPPYLAERTNGYDRDVDSEDFHKRLLRLANKAKCMIIISGYQNQVYEAALSRERGWSVKRIKASTRDSSGQTHRRTEIIWMNKHCTNARKAGKVPVKLTKSEVKQGKVNPKRA